MTIPLDIQQRVTALVGTGRYGSEAEVLRAAVGALEAQDADQASIRSGIEDMKNGRTCSFADFDAEFRKRNKIENAE